MVGDIVGTGEVDETVGRAVGLGAGGGVGRGVEPGNGMNVGIETELSLDSWKERRMVSRMA